MEATPAEKGATDWEAVEGKYRAGILSLRLIGEQHGISEGGIRKRAKAHGWERDLTARVAERVRTEIVRIEERKAITPESLRTEEEIIAQAAATVVQVVREHRHDIARSRGIVAMLSSQLLNAAMQREDLIDTIHEETATDRSAERRNKMLRAVALPAHAATARDLSNAMKNLFYLERQAFSIGDAPTETPNDEPGGTQVEEGYADLRTAFSKRIGTTSTDDNDTVEAA